MYILFIYSQSFSLGKKLIFEDVRIFCGEPVAHVFRKVEGTHHETEHDIKHGQERNRVIFAEGLDQHKRHLEYVFEDLNVFDGTVSSLGEIYVLVSFLFPLESKMNP